jgi:hypothetical protein
MHVFIFTQLFYNKNNENSYMFQSHGHVVTTDI